MRASLSIVIAHGFVGSMLLSIGCSGSSQSDNQKAPAAAASKNSGKGTNDAGDDESVDEETVDDGETKVAANAKGAYLTFCKLAAETPVVQDQLGDYFEKFCSNGKPTELFATSLVKGAFDGEGTPGIKKMEDWVEDKAAKTTSGFFGNAIVLPITAKQHFADVGPRGGDVEALDALASAGGAEGHADIEETYKKGDQGEYYVRGWKIHQTATKQIPGLPVKMNTETIARTDQWELKAGEAYMYTSYLLESVKMIKTFDMFTACVQVGDNAYLLTLARLEVDNKGFHSVAVKEIQNTAAAIVKAMYAAAEAVSE